MQPPVATQGRREVWLHIGIDSCSPFFYFVISAFLNENVGLKRGRCTCLRSFHKLQCELETPIYAACRSTERQAVLSPLIHKGKWKMSKEKLVMYSVMCVCVCGNCR
ncbi:hypothetical protein JOB18_006199 [Solea senegalensis]|uniref:Uncharacterized protein n=1 Tax=Solea senegalensis TaxID=28829 RepID=A0AAV6Q0Y3_SOLSE|nr:hypothetical protein JOB18_006199 [Solea senegalensis]KAG7481823.1 hypothetical protein JOB18_006199 [Solea senegalensis]KAG7481824.1 hypothetical protein JOB18_006199 [Solea senegalensis]KAG7481825.1 hypothetical protein JOB18_006199 [Solea senegalensis]KAG7481826.1 hypothetical protein JOB18_006199 [Solea senegalensis]